MSGGRSIIIRGDAHRLPLPNESVDLIITSPPYYSQRAYQDGGRKYAGQLGAESTWQQYIHGLLDCTEEWIRVLKPSGSMFINLGDKYSSGNGGVRNKYPSKSLLLLPERYRIAAVDRFGLSARAVIVWSKPNGLPESVTDRVRRSHEDWVHLVKQPRYFAAVDEIREPYGEPQRRGAMTWDQRRGRNDKAARYSDQNGHGGTAGMARSPLGKLPGSVWSVAAEPLRIPEHLGLNHFATFPTEWPLRLILGWSPPGICLTCGNGLTPVIHHEGVTPREHLESVGRTARYSAVNGQGLDHTGYSVMRTHFRTDSLSCLCPRIYHKSEVVAITSPAVVLDPFGGTGTVALVAKALGRIGISVDLSHDYCRLATWRTTDPKQRERVQRKIRDRRNQKQAAVT